MLNNLIELAKQLYPTGRSFRMPKSGVRERVQRALSGGDEYLLNNAYGILDSILPDNPNFTSEDATRWEERLGMIVNPQVDLEDRKLAIRRKMNHPGTIIARQSRDYIQDQLRAAGFDLYVYENINQIDPLTYFGLPTSGLAIHAPDVYHMSTDLYHGSYLLWNDVVANNIDFEKDIFFNIGANLSCTFYICSATQGEFANVEAIRREELRKLILSVKPTQTIAYLGINYI